MTVTPADIARARQEYKTRVEQHVTDIVQLLSLQPEDHPVHNVEKYRDGIRVPIHLSGGLTVYVYCLPWARGWSVFADTLAEDIYSFSWRYVTQKWRSYQQPIYNPRDTSGPWHCPPSQIVAALEYTVRRVKQIDKRRAPQISRREGN